MQVGTTKDQGLYNKPSAAVQPGALAAGTLPHYNSVVGVVNGILTGRNAIHTPAGKQIFLLPITFC